MNDYFPRIRINFGILSMQIQKGNILTDIELFSNTDTVFRDHSIFLDTFF